jgi:hypothetical protein
MADYTIKQFGDVLIAGSRFRGEFVDIPSAFRRLREKAAPHVSGHAICLYYGMIAEGQHDLEVCYPVAERVEAEGVDCRHLEGASMFALPHSGARDTAAAVWGYMADGVNESLPNQPPHAIVYLEAGDELRDSAEECAAELLVPPWSSYWLDMLGEGVAALAGEEVRQYVMAGVERITLDTTPGERAAWIVGALERLEEKVPDEEARSRIMRGCSHRFPRWRIAQMRAEYERLGSIDALLAIMHADRSVYGQPWYGQQIRIGNIIYTAKSPVDQAGYRNAETHLERRMACCFCGLVKEYMRSGGQAPFTHCYCGAGWFHQLWEGILGKPVTVEILTSALRGDDTCTFAVHLPDDI